MGRHSNPEPRTFTSARTKGDRTVHQAGIRYAYNKRLYLGTYGTQEQAQAAADFILKHPGDLIPKELGAIPVGRPRKAQKPRQKPRKAPIPQKPIKASAAPSHACARPLPELDRETRLETLKRLYRACY